MLGNVRRILLDLNLKDTQLSYGECLPALNYFPYQTRLEWYLLIYVWTILESIILNLSSTFFAIFTKRMFLWYQSCQSRPYWEATTNDSNVAYCSIVFKNIGYISSCQIPTFKGKQVVFPWRSLGNKCPTIGWIIRLMQRMTLTIPWLWKRSVE